MKVLTFIFLICNAYKKKKWAIWTLISDKGALKAVGMWP